ncbi:MAG: MgtC/SapB family protein [Candidatus Saccharimonadaceae bacterium]
MLLSTFVLRLLASIVAGGFVGLERQFNNKSAGFRTNTLVAMGACIYVLINVKLTGNGGDPTRIIGQIVTGIGFLGAGVILHHGGNIHGLTTAATIWCSAALGSLAGLGLYWEALICTSAVVIINTTFKAERYIRRPVKNIKKPNSEQNEPLE